MRYKIIRTFGACLNFEKDQIRELTDVEALRYAQQIEKVESHSETFLDRSITKGKKKGRKQG